MRRFWKWLAEQVLGEAFAELLKYLAKKGLASAVVLAAGSGVVLRLLEYPVDIGVLAAIFTVSLAWLIAMRILDGPPQLRPAPTGAPRSQEESRMHIPVEFLEAGRRDLLAKREKMINDWRTMVSKAHRDMRDMEELAADPLAGGNVQVPLAAELLEADERFPSLRPYLSERSKRALYSLIKDDKDEPPVALTMDYALSSVLEDIDALAKQWGID